MKKNRFLLTKPLATLAIFDLVIIVTCFSMLHLIEKEFTETISKKQLLMSISKLIFQVETAVTNSYQSKEGTAPNKLSSQINPIESLFKDYDQSAYRIAQPTINEIKARLEMIESLKINLNHSLTQGDDSEVEEIRQKVSESESLVQMNLRELNQLLFAFISEELAITDNETRLVILWKSLIVIIMFLLFGFSQFYRMKLHKKISLYNKNFMGSLDFQKYLIESKNAAIYQTDELGMITFVDERWCKISGVDRDKAIGKLWIDHIFLKDQGHVKQLWSNFDKNTESFSCEFRFLHGDGSIKSVFTIAHKIVDQSGSICGYTGMVLDLYQNLPQDTMLGNLREALDAAVIIAVTDKYGVITYANKAFCRISQFDEKELIGRTHAIVNSKNHPKSFFINMWSTISSGKIWNGEICNRAKDGSYYWVDTTIVPFLDAQGKPHQYLAIRHDISVRKKQEDLLTLLNAIQNRYLQFQEFPEQLFTEILSLFLRFTKSEIGFIKMTGHNSIDQIDQSSLIIIKSNQQNQVDRLKLTGDEFSKEMRTLIKRGKYLKNPEYAKIEVAYDETGNLGKSEASEILSYLLIPLYQGQKVVATLGVLNNAGGYSEDLVENLRPVINVLTTMVSNIESQEKGWQYYNQLKDAQAKIEQNLELFKSLSDNVPVLVWMSGESSLCTFVNKSWIDFTGRSFEDELGHGWIESIYPGDREEFLANYNKSFFGMVDFTTRFRLLHHSGEYRWISNHGVPRYKSDGSFIGFISSCTDITDELESQRKIEESRVQALHASKMAILGEMAGGVAHEINNPLAIIQAATRKVRRVNKINGIENTEIEKALEVTEATTLRIAKIIKGLRSFARDEKQDDMTIINVAELISETLTFCAERFKNHGIFLEVKADQQDLDLECRPVQISQVLLNLLQNSADAVDNLEEKWIRLEVIDSNHFIEISVTDSGKGIQKDILERILQPFFTTKPVGKGTGLGLSISKGIVESHNGILRYDENSLNTRFIFQLPKRQQEVYLLSS